MDENGTSRDGVVSAHKDLPPERIIFGRSTAMRALRQKVEKISATKLPVLIEGQGGTGKEILARWIHAQSPWNSGPFAKISCAAIPGTLLESELFGYEKGAFTGANGAKPGRLELARGGALFLDEIAELDQGLQAKLLQLLEDGRFSRLGGVDEQRLEARIVCATNRNLAEEMQSGRFRPDLYYRITAVQVHLPLLSERREDVLEIADHFLGAFNAQYGRSMAPFTKEMRQSLESCEWRGNIRELENRIARYVLLGSDEEYEWRMTEHSRRASASQTVGNANLPLKQRMKDAIREMERGVILRVLRENHWNRRRTAQALSISYRALIYKIREAGLGQKDTIEG